ncbi:MAG: MFS transporter [bacterium]|nr:MFS transporter [bacterium]
MEPKRIFGLRKNVFWLGIVSLINDFSSEMVYSVMPAFLTVVLGAPAVLVGFLEGFADALASVLKIYFGWLSDKLGKRKSLAVSGYTLSVATRWFLAMVVGFWQVFLLRAIDRIGKGLRDSPRDALIAESVDRHELGKSFGYHRAMDTVGAMLGPLTAAFLLPIFLNDYRLIFQVAFLAGIFAVLSFIFVRDVPRPKAAENVQLSERFSFSLKPFSGVFKRYILAVFIFGLGSMPITLILLKTQEAGLGSAFMPLIYFISSFTFVLFAIPAGKLADKIGDRKLIILGFIMAILSYFNFAYFSSLASVIAGFVTFGLYSAMTDGVQRALASKLVPDNRLAAGQGFLNAAIGFSSLLAGVIGGGIWTVWGSDAAFLYGLVMMIIGLLTFIGLNSHGKEL